MPKGKCLEGCNQMSWTENNVSARYFGGERKKVLLQQKTSILKIRKDVITFPLKRILLDSLHCCSIPPKFGCLGDYNTRLLAP